MTIREQIRPTLMILLLFTLLTGAVYPLLVTGIAQVALPGRASGSLIERDGTVVGSALIGQEFSEPGYFWGRPSATGPQPYNAAASSGSNLGPTSAALQANAQARIDALEAANAEFGVETDAAMPVDLVTASASGLDPQISPAAAAYQTARVAAARGLDEATVAELVAEHTEGRTLGLLGEPRVNVLELNLALDGLE